jgi:hypothetical protein
MTIDEMQNLTIILVGLAFAIYVLTRRRDR